MCIFSHFLQDGKLAADVVEREMGHGSDFEDQVDGTFVKFTNNFKFWAIFGIFEFEDVR